MKAERQIAQLKEFSTTPFLNGRNGSIQAAQNAFFQPRPFVNLQNFEYDQEPKITSNKITQCDAPGIQLKGKDGFVTPTDAERKEYEQMQEEFFRQQGEIMKEQILKNAGFGKTKQLTTLQDAEKLIAFWGLSIPTIIAEMQKVVSSLGTAVIGQHTAGSLASQQQSFIDALSTKGKKAYQQAIKLVRKEPYWDNYFKQHDIYIFPDLASGNRFSGYNQVANDPADPTGQRKVIIVHISNLPLENEFPDQSATTIVHELSHAIYDPAVLKRALAGLRNSAADLLLEHPEIVSQRQKAVDTSLAKEEQRKRIMQILFEVVAYGETEIFVHLQQLTHQPDLVKKTAEGDVQIRSAEYVLTEVSRYVQKMQKIGLAPHMLKGVLDQLGRRVSIMYDNRIAAYPPKSKQREILESYKKMAELILEMARSGYEL